MFVFTLCWMPAGIYVVTKLIGYMDGQEEAISEERCADLQMHYSNTSSQHGKIQHEWLNKRRLDIFPCLHTLISPNEKQCVIHPNSSDTYIVYDVCMDVLYYTRIYVTTNFTYIVWIIAALNSLFNPLIYALMSKDFKLQIKKMKRRIYAYFGLI